MAYLTAPESAPSSTPWTWVATVPPERKMWRTMEGMFWPKQQYRTSQGVAVSIFLLQVKWSKAARPPVAPPPALREEVTGMLTPKPYSVISIAPRPQPGSGFEVDSPKIPWLKSSPLTLL